MEPFMVIGGWPLPEPPFDSYKCGDEPGVVQVEMINRRIVQEIRGGNIYRPSCTYDYLEDSVVKPVLAVLRSGAPFLATVPTDNSDTPVTAYFVVESLTDPKLMALDGTKPIWHGLAFTLREERPHG